MALPGAAYGPKDLFSEYKLTFMVLALIIFALILIIVSFSMGKSSKSKEEEETEEFTSYVF